MPKFTSLGYFIVDEFHYLDARGDPTGKQSRAQVRLTELFDTSILITYIPISHFYLYTQIGGGGTYAAIGARLWYVGLYAARSPFINRESLSI